MKLVVTLIALASSQQLPIIILNPYSTITWEAGKQQTIKWQLENQNAPQKVNLYLMKDRATPQIVKNFGSVESKSLSFVVTPDSTMVAEKYYIAIGDWPLNVRYSAEFQMNASVETEKPKVDEKTDKDEKPVTTTPTSNKNSKSGAGILAISIFAYCHFMLV